MEPEATLKDCVRRHRVTWELGPWQEMVGHRPATVGFELRLFAQHGHDVHPTPGCAECAALHEKLRAIALSALPKESRPTRYDIEPFHPTLHMRPESGWKPEVQLTLHITHRQGYFGPVDDCETRCVRDIETGLRALGAQPKRWPESSSAR